MRFTSKGVNRKTESAKSRRDISKSNNESARLDYTITPSMCSNAARIRATFVEC